MFNANRLPLALRELTEGNNTVPCHRPWAAAMEANARKFAEQAGCDVGKMSPDRIRLMAALGAIQISHFEQARESGAFGLSRNGVTFGEGPGLRAQENTTPADIANFTTQQIAFVRELAEAWVLPEIVTTIPLTGPTGFVHRENATREDADAAYAAGTALLEGKDPSYSDCPAACAEANGVDYSIDSELVEYVCKRLKGTFCYPAQFQVQSQYGFTLDSRLTWFMREKLKRDVQAEVIDDVVANAGSVILWNATPTAGSYYASANPQEWQATLYNQITQASSDIVADPEGRIGGANQILADLKTVTRLKKLIPFRIRWNPGDAANLNTAAIDAMQEQFGIERFGEYPVVRVPTMADNTMIVQRKDDSDPTYAYCPWIVLQSLGMLLHPETAKVQMGMIHLYAKKAIRSGRIVEIRITPET